MLSVSIPRDLTIARAKTVFMVTAQSALVSICNMFYVSLRYFNVKLSDNCFIVKALSVLSFTNTDHKHGSEFNIRKILHHKESSVTNH